LVELLRSPKNSNASADNIGGHIVIYLALIGALIGVTCATVWG